MPSPLQPGNEPPAPQPAAARLRHERERLFRETVAAGLIRSDFSHLLSRITDRYFHSRYLEIQAGQDRLPPHSFTVLAVGGYGRSELCPRSDLNVLVLFQEGVPEAAADFCRDLFLPLWDLGLELGHGVRGLDECLALATKDHATFTSLSSARHLVGDHLLAGRFIREFIDLIAHSDPLSLSALAENHGFQENFGTIPELPAESLLEPNLKNGSGGLRDYHRLLWLSIPSLCHEQNRIITRPVGPFTEGDELQLHRDVTFLLQARSALHLVTGRKTDVLHLDLQTEVARLTGYAASDSGLAVEEFLAALHKVMQRIRAMSQSVYRTIQAQLSPDSLPLEAFRSMNQEQGIVLSADGLSFQRERRSVFPVAGAAWEWLPRKSPICLRADATRSPSRSWSNRASFRCSAACLLCMDWMCSLPKW